MKVAAALLVLLVVGLIDLQSVFVSCEPRLIEFGPHQRKWMDRSQVDDLVQEGKMNNFMDITESPEVTVTAPKLDTPYPDGPKHQDVVDALLPQLKVDQIQATISTLSNYFNRYYTTDTGYDAAGWLHSKYKEYAGDKDYIDVSFFQNTFKQPSVIARITGSDPQADGIVILGGHEDSTAGGPTRQSPGADDDASGSSTVLEVFRVLTANNFRPIRTIEFHAYAAEEAGLLGSAAIAKTYASDGKKVYGMLQLDMTGYTPPGKIPVVGLIFDYVNLTLTNYVSRLIDGYANIGWEQSKCGYACSDHASWTRYGYPSAFPFETRFNDLNPNIHTDRDTLDKMNLEHAIEFAKVGLAFVVELGLTGQ